jgi:hypothetical protein
MTRKDKTNPKPYMIPTTRETDIPPENPLREAPTTKKFPDPHPLRDGEVSEPQLTNPSGKKAKPVGEREEIGKDTTPL